MATWEEIRDEVAGMLADGEPLEDVIAKLEKRKNEMAKANLLKAMDDMKKREQTNEEWLKQANTEQMADFIADVCYELLDDVWSNDGDTSCDYRETEKNYWVEWLKQPHQKE